MEHTEAINVSRSTVLVPDDKFDRHMARARVTDIDSRKAMFDSQTQDTVDKRVMRSSIRPLNIDH
jgi:hypothetical protein